MCLTVYSIYLYKEKKKHVYEARNKKYVLLPQMGEAAARKNIVKSCHVHNFFILLSGEAIYISK